MDTRTGEILTFKDQDALQKALMERPDLVPLEQLPSKTCPKCHGRGHKLTRGKNGMFKPCPCTGKVKVKPREQRHVAPGAFRPGGAAQRPRKAH